MGVLGLLQDGVITGSTNVTAFVPSASAPQSVSFNPDYSKELSTVTIGKHLFFLSLCSQL